MAAGEAELAAGARAGGDRGSSGAVGDERGEAVAAAGEGGVAGDAALVEGGAREPGVGEVGLRRQAVEGDEREAAVLLDARDRGAAAPVGGAAGAALDQPRRGG